MKFEIFSKINRNLIEVFLFFPSKFLKSQFSLVYLILFLGFLCGLNILLLVASVQDYFILPNAVEYQLPSKLYAINRKKEYEVIAEYYKFSRIQLVLKDLKGAEDSVDSRPKIVQCFLATEDNNFYDHFGIDLKGILRAAIVNILAGRIREGASTITMQVARLKFLSFRRTFIRKAKEAWLSFLLELYYDKNTIMEIYLNEIPLGHGTEGVGAAARFYFRKSIDELSWGEAALLASLTTRPKEFSPLVNPITSMNKVQVVFKKLVETGKMDVKKAEKEYALLLENYYSNLNRSPNASAFADRLNRFPYFTEQIRKTLLSKKIVTRKQLYTGGLRIYSTLNIHHQEVAEEVMSKTLEKQTKISNQRIFKKTEIFDKRYGSVYDMINFLSGMRHIEYEQDGENSYLVSRSDIPDFKFKISRIERKFKKIMQEKLRENLSVLNIVSGTDSVGEVIDQNFITQKLRPTLLQVEGALISMRPKTGYITALIGGTEFRSDNQKIRPFQAYRQPGSSFKPLVYSSAIEYSGQNPDEENPENNITASTLFLDSPLQFLLEGGDEWSPENYSMEYSGFMRLRRALVKSKNSVAVRVVEQLGISKIHSTLTDLLQLGKRREIPRNYSIALGSFEVTPYEMARAYGTIASGGKELKPMSILYITDHEGQLFRDFRLEKENETRKQVLSPETCFIITSMMEDVIKHGTGKAVQNYNIKRRVAGKTGTTNNYLDAWFVGFTPELVTAIWFGYDRGTVSLGKGMTGGRVAAPAWGEYMSKSLKDEPVKDFDFGEEKIVKEKVCELSGKLPTKSCKKVIEEYFIEKTVPTEECDVHGGGFGYSP